MKVLIGSKDSKQREVDLYKELGAFFAPEDLEIRPGMVSKKTSKGLALVYVTNRAIMERLDEVVGPENWRNEFTTGPGGGVMCGLSININGEWVTKWDGAENTDIEPVKGGLSNAMKRAGYQWNIGRYLYNVPDTWIPVNERGQFDRNFDISTIIPDEFLPEGYKRKKTGRAKSEEPQQEDNSSKTSVKKTTRARKQESSKQEAAQPEGVTNNRELAVKLAKLAENVANWKVPTLVKYLKDTYNKKASELTEQEYKEVVEHLNSLK